MDANTSPYGLAALWSQGDLVIKTVAVMLLIMSIASWWLIITRSWRLMKLRRAAKAAAAFWHTKSFAEGLQALQAPGTRRPNSTPSATLRWRARPPWPTTRATRRTCTAS